MSEYKVHEFYVTAEFYDVFPSGQGAAVQAAGAES